MTCKSPEDVRSAVMFSTNGISRPYSSKTGRLGRLAFCVDNFYTPFTFVLARVKDWEVIPPVPEVQNADIGMHQIKGNLPFAADALIISTGSPAF